MTALPLVLLPGLVCDASVWAAQTHAFHREREVLAWPDFYGQDSLGSMAEAVLSRTPRRFVLAGHSMGARVALEIMARSPERVEKLALLDTGVLPAAPDEPARRQPLLDIARDKGWPDWRQHGCRRSSIRRVWQILGSCRRLPM